MIFLNILTGLLANYGVGFVVWYLLDEMVNRTYGDVLLAQYGWVQFCMIQLWPAAVGAAIARRWMR